MSKKPEIGITYHFQQGGWHGTHVVTRYNKRFIYYVIEDYPSKNEVIEFRTTYRSFWNTHFGKGYIESSRCLSIQGENWNNSQKGIKFDLTKIKIIKFKLKPNSKNINHVKEN